MGSPHKDGMTNKLVTRAIEGSKEASASTEIMYLIDYDIPQLSESHKRAPEELCLLMGEADAYVLGAPVNILDVNGLTKDFMDIFFMCPNAANAANGKPGLGIAMAGGLGLGMVSALETLYQFFTSVGIRGIDLTFSVNPS